MQYTIFLTLSPIVTIATIVASFFTIRQKGSKGAVSLTTYLWASTIFTIINTLELLAKKETQILLCVRCNYIFISLIPVLFFLFALEYSGMENRISRTRLPLLFIIPLITIVAVFTNEFHHLIWTSIKFKVIRGFLTIHVTYGLWFWVHTVYSYSLILLSVFLLCRTSFQNYSLYRKRQELIIIGVFVPLILNVIYSFKLIPGFTKNYTPIGFGVAGVLFAINTQTFHLFDIKPIAQQALIENMRDGMIIINAHRCIVEMNRSAKNVIGGTDMIGKSVTEIPFFSDIDFSSSAFETWRRGITGPGGRVYNICITPLTERGKKANGEKGERAGTLVTMYNVTEVHELIKEKNRLIGELQAALSEIKTLQGILPICVNCKRVRDDEGYWHQVDMYMSEHSNIRFSHGLCPTCYKKLYPEEDFAEKAHVPERKERTSDENSSG
ncbi:MAG TPA: histidine kinase N-terminal 7TM domain-containing protein [Spirochaetia bacterium]|nr:histidine kinase N-terminal 7TM domain-containing protein [Spirochaetia bacterium]